MHTGMLYPVRRAGSISLKKPASLVKLQKYSIERRCAMVIVMVGPEDDDGPVDDNNKDNKRCYPGHSEYIIMLD